MLTHQIIQSMVGRREVVNESNFKNLLETFITSNDKEVVKFLITTYPKYFEDTHGSLNMKFKLYLKINLIIP